MDLTATKNITARECQRRLFIDSLYKELDKVAASVDKSNSKLIARANKYLFQDELPKDACVDMLIMEGFDDKKARKCVETASAFIKENSETLLSKYDYCFEDHRGRTFTGKELGNLVEASSDEEALSLVKETLASFDPPVSLINIQKIG